MKIVAQNVSTLVIEKEDRWEIYDFVGEEIVAVEYFVNNPMFIDALLYKWGYDQVDPPVEINNYEEIDVDPGMFGMDQEEFDAKREYLQRKIIFKSLRDELNRLKR